MVFLYFSKSYFVFGNRILKMGNLYKGNICINYVVESNNLGISEYTHSKKNLSLMYEGNLHTIEYKTK